MRREIFFWLAFKILFFYTQLNEADNPLPWGQSRLTNKPIMANLKVSANLKITWSQTVF